MLGEPFMYRQNRNQSATGFRLASLPLYLFHFSFQGATPALVAYLSPKALNFSLACSRSSQA